MNLNDFILNLLQMNQFTRFMSTRRRQLCLKGKVVTWTLKLVGPNFYLSAKVLIDWIETEVLIINFIQLLLINHNQWTKLDSIKRDLNNALLHSQRVQWHIFILWNKTIDLHTYVINQMYSATIYPTITTTIEIMESTAAYETTNGKA